MSGRKTIFAAKTIAILSTIPVLIHAYSTGPDARSTGAPGDAICTRCHSGTVNSGPGSVTIAFAGGQTYTPGQTKRLTVTVADPDQRRWGFQVTARLGTNLPAGQAGSFVPVDAFTQVKCEDDSIRSAGQACPSTGPLEFIEHTEAGTRPGTANEASFLVDWKAPATNVGDVVFYVAGNAANNDSRNSGDRIYAANFTVKAAAAGAKPAIKATGGVVNGAGYQPAITAGSWVTVYGQDLAGTARTWRADEIVNGKLPTQLDGVAVNINGKPAAVAYISPNQINVVAGVDAADGDVQVEVVRDGQTSAPAMARLQKFSPAFFLWEGKYVVATDTSYRYRAKAGLFPGLTTIPAAPGDVLVFWGTGFGPTKPEIVSLQLAAQAGTVQEPVKVFIDGMAAEVLGAALSPGFAGLYQVAVKVPEAARAGDLSVIVDVGGYRSPDNVLITVQR